MDKYGSLVFAVWFLVVALGLLAASRAFDPQTEKPSRNHLTYMATWPAIFAICILKVRYLPQVPYYVFWVTPLTIGGAWAAVRIVKQLWAKRQLNALIRAK